MRLIRKNSCGLAVQFLNHDKIEEEIRHSDTESESLEDDYQNANLAKEGWSKKPEKKYGCYQQKRALNFRIYLKDTKKRKKQKLENNGSINNKNKSCKRKLNSKKPLLKKLKENTGKFNT